MGEFLAVPGPSTSAAQRPPHRDFPVFLSSSPIFQPSPEILIPDMLLSVEYHFLGSMSAGSARRSFVGTRGSGCLATFVSRSGEHRLMDYRVDFQVSQLEVAAYATSLRD